MIKSLRLQNFRSYSDYTTELSEGVNIVVGPNASGKTNLLEALYVANTGKSFRVKDTDLIQIGKEWARIDQETEDGLRIWKLDDSKERTEKTLEANGEVKKIISRNQKIPTTLFEPSHLRLLTGSPDTRRSYLDQLLSQSDTRYAGALRKYSRALKQRNALLKQGSIKEDDIFVWDVKLSEYGGFVNSSRKALIELINNEISQDYSEIAGEKTKIEIVYKDTVSSADYNTSLLKKLQNSLDEHIARGYTPCGPHREDFEVIMNGNDASVKASRGESRTLVLVLKLIELSQLEQRTERKPTLLLDDVFSELDGARRKALTEHISGYQTIITTTDAEAVIEHFNTGEYKIIPTTSG